MKARKLLKRTKKIKKSSLKPEKQPKVKKLLKRISKTFLVDNTRSVVKPFAMSLVNRLLVSSLSKHYLYLGQKKNQTHQEYRPFLLGFHNNISYINSSILVYYLRRLSRFIFILLMRNYRFCFVSQQLDSYLAESSILRNYYLILDYWIPGTVSNYLILKKQLVRQENNFLLRFPQVLITFKLEPDKVYAINNEARKSGVPLIALLDTNLSPAYFNYFLPVNTKNLRSFQYCIFLITSLIHRAMLTKKKLFFKRTAKCF